MQKKNKKKQTQRTRGFHYVSAFNKKKEDIWIYLIYIYSCTYRFGSMIKMADCQKKKALDSMSVISYNLFFSSKSNFLVLTLQGNRFILIWNITKEHHIKRKTLQFYII